MIQTSFETFQESAGFLCNSDPEQRGKGNKFSFESMMTGRRKKEGRERKEIRTHAKIVRRDVPASQAGFCSTQKASRKSASNTGEKRVRGKEEERRTNVEPSFPS